MKKIIEIPLILLLMLMLSILPASAIEYEFSPGDESIASEEIDKLFEALPENIKDKLLPINESSGENISKKYSFEFFWNVLKESFAELLPDCLNMMSASVGTILIISIFKHLQNTVSCTAISPAMNMCTGMISALIISSMQKTIIAGVNSFLSVLSDTMLLIVPIMEGIYISGGNFTLASVTSTGLNVMIAFTQSLFADYLSPAISVLLLLSTLAAVTGNKGIIFLSRTIRTVITAVIMIIMTLMTFALTLQGDAAATVDNFSTRTIRFALGSYIPVVGGAVSETYSLIKNSVSLIKNLSGVTGVVILILLCAGPIISLVLARFSAYVAENLSGMLGCDSEQVLYSEIGSSYTLLIAITVSSVLIYIFALAQFCKSSIAIS